MKVPSGGRTTSVSFNVTSLIDIVFLLVIFFLVASHIARTEAVEPIKLPEATQFEDEEDATPRRLVVTVKADGSLDIAGQPAELVQVEQRIVSGNEDSGGRFEVRIRSDRDAPYQKIEPILLACARHGVSTVGFAVTPKIE
ncbi:biopolymer transporter ExbD [bacterium]|nr:biopolymer transporter ExbD [bacterium]